MALLNDVEAAAYGMLTLGDRERAVLNPGSPQATENWVKTMVHHALEMGRNFNRDLISDAFPRNVQQLKWLLHSSYASNHTIGIEIRFLYVDELVHGVRLKQRLDACKTKDECEFLRQRHETDRHGVVSVFEEASKMINPAIIVRFMLVLSIFKR